MMISAKIRIPLERIAVLIGQNGKTKLQLESEANVELDIDSEEGQVEVLATDEAEDPTIVWAVRDCVQAIGRGFSPQRAFALLDPDIFLEIIPLEGPPKWIQRMRGRLIGERGKTRRIIEQNTDAQISVFGQTVAIIGTLEEIKAAKEAIEMLLRGDRHSSVYRYLQNLRFQQKLKPSQLWRDEPSDAFPSDFYEE
ncbi:MAG: KH domain-containing protein [Candidatus Hodarchaeales archaeon]|jgi:ribosomal RNA assembly protein